MTDIRKAAEERYPEDPSPNFVVKRTSEHNAFVAGAEWMREEAVRSINALPVDRGQTRMAAPMVSLAQVLAILKETAQ